MILGSKFQKKNWEYEEIVDIFAGSLQNWIILEGWVLFIYFLGFFRLKYRMEIFLRSQNFKYVLGLVLPDISNIFCKQ